MGAALKTTSYADAHGSLRWRVKSSPTSQFSGADSFFFTGQQFDAETPAPGGQPGEKGMYYMGARYYDPSLGRFLSRDPLSGSRLNPQAQNAYAYALNDPVNLVDPTGLASETSSGHQDAGGLEEAIIEELLLQDCIKLSAITLILIALGLVFLGLPALAGVGGLAGALLVGFSTLNAGVTFGASFGVGYAA